jgi:histidyl-tRNA synthetase
MSQLTSDKNKYDKSDKNLLRGRKKEKGEKIRFLYKYLELKKYISFNIDTYRVYRLKFYHQ